MRHFFYVQRRIVFLFLTILFVVQPALVYSMRAQVLREVVRLGVSAAYAQRERMLDELRNKKKEKPTPVLAMTEALSSTTLYVTASVLHTATGVDYRPRKTSDEVWFTHGDLYSNETPQPTLADQAAMEAAHQVKPNIAHEIQDIERENGFFDYVHAACSWLFGDKPRSQKDGYDETYVAPNLAKRLNISREEALNVVQAYRQQQAAPQKTEPWDPSFSSGGEQIFGFSNEAPKKINHDTACLPVQAVHSLGHEQNNPQPEQDVIVVTPEPDVVEQTPYVPINAPPEPIVQEQEAFVKALQAKHPREIEQEALWGFKVTLGGTLENAASESPIAQPEQALPQPQASQEILWSYTTVLGKTSDTAANEPPVTQPVQAPETKVSQENALNVSTPTDSAKNSAPIKEIDNVQEVQKAQANTVQKIAANSAKKNEPKGGVASNVPAPTAPAFTKKAATKKIPTATAATTKKSSSKTVSVTRIEEPQKGVVEAAFEGADKILTFFEALDYFFGDGRSIPKEPEYKQLLSACQRAQQRGDRPCENRVNILYREINALPQDQRAEALQDVVGQFEHKRLQHEAYERHRRWHKKIPQNFRKGATREWLKEHLRDDPHMREWYVDTLTYELKQELLQELEQERIAQAQAAASVKQQEQEKVLQLMGSDDAVPSIPSISGGSISPMPNGPKKDDEDKNRIKISEKDKHHIFRKSRGHFPDDTPEAREIIEEVTNDKNNFNGTNKHGVDEYSKVLKNGKQIWSGVRNGKIRYAGINETPWPKDPETGLLVNPNKFMKKV